MSQMSKVVCRSRRAFTLIEMLMVVAIISLLAAILFPVFQRARANARRATCQSNLKQLALGVIQYSQDNDERMPLLVERGTTGGLFDTKNGKGLTWCDGVFPYVRTKNVFYCPDAVGNRTYSHYGLNIFFSRPFSKDYDNTRENIQFPISSVVRPSQLILLSDIRPTNFSFTNDYNTDNGGYVQYTTFPGVSNTTWINDGRFDPVSGRHLEGANYAFMDGHIKFMKRQARPGTTGESTVYERVEILADANDFTVNWTDSRWPNSRIYWSVFK